MSKGSSAGRKFRVVLDTNVYLPAFHYPESELYEIWLHASKHTYQLLVSPAIIREVSRTLRHKQYFEWEEERVIEHLKLIVHTAAIVVPASVPDVLQTDPADTRFRSPPAPATSSRPPPQSAGVPAAAAPVF